MLPVRGRGVGMRWTLRSHPAQTILGFRVQTWFRIWWKHQTPTNSNRALTQANLGANFPPDFKLACDTNTGGMHCRICCLHLEFQALPLTCTTLSILELQVWATISLLCHCAIHEMLRGNGMSVENLPLPGPEHLESAPDLGPFVPHCQTFIQFANPARKAVSWAGHIYAFCVFCVFFTWLLELGDEAPLCVGCTSL